MSDRELLELAAKEAGMEYPNGQTYCEVHGVWGMLEKRPYQWWNPLTDDGDALRLAVKKQILTVHYAMFLKFLHEELDLDRKPSEATRRAIVRAAAAIGKEMP